MMGLKAQLVNLLTVNKKSEIELLNEFRKRNGFDLTVFANQQKEYDARLREFEE